MRIQVKKLLTNLRGWVFHTGSSFLKLIFSAGPDYKKAGSL